MPMKRYGEVPTAPGWEQVPYSRKFKFFTKLELGIVADALKAAHGSDAETLRLEFQCELDQRGFNERGGSGE